MRRLFLAPLAAILMLAFANGAWAQMTASVYDFEFEAIEGGKLPLITSCSPGWIPGRIPTLPWG